MWRLFYASKAHFENLTAASIAADNLRIWCVDYCQDISINLRNGPVFNGIGVLSIPSWGKSAIGRGGFWGGWETSAFLFSKRPRFEAVRAECRVPRKTTH